jgi:hypothetical protein
MSGAFSCIWRRAARIHEFSIARYLRCGSFFGSRSIIEHTHFIHEARKLPVVLSPEEVARLLNAAPGLKYKAAQLDPPS